MKSAGAVISRRAFGAEVLNVRQKSIHLAV